MMSRILEELHKELKNAGFKPGTVEYEKERRKRQIELCKNHRGADSCWDCAYFDICEMIKAYLRDIYNVDQKKTPDRKEQTE